MCNYKNNGVTRFTADAIAEKLCRDTQMTRLSVKTPLGDIVAEVSTDSSYPGVWVTLHREGESYVLTLALVEYTATETDLEAPAIITRVWADVEQEEHTDRVIHTGLREVSTCGGSKNEGEASNENLSGNPRTGH